jgi:hypothetical protein
VARIGALLLRAEGQGRFVPASVALRVAPTPPLTRVPGSPPGLVGVALYEGVVVPVLSIGPSRGDMVVCACDGELVAIVGGEAFETGTFESSRDSIEVLEHAGSTYTALDVPALRAAVEQTTPREPWSG